MSEPGKNDHWDLLASELGAEPTPEAVDEGPGSAAERPDATGPPPPPGVAVDEGPSEKQPAKGRRAAPNWDAVASALGLTPEPEPAEAPPAGEPAEAAVRKAGRERPRDEADPGEVGERPAGIGQRRESTFERPRPKRFEGPARPAEKPAEMAEESSLIAEGAAGGSQGRDDVTEERKPARRRRKRRRKPREPGKAAGEHRDAEKTDQVSEAAVLEPEEGEAVREEGQPEKGRAKRRRKRVLPHKKRRTSVADEAAADEAEETPTKPDKTATKAAESAEIDVEEDEMEDDETAESVGPSKASHRAIPTWGEAVGLLISANLEARAKNPSTGFSRGRGKGRGSRERPPEKKKS